MLSDGTKVWLNSDSKIKYPTNFNRKQREIYLDGEAYFEVSKDKYKPFIVHSSGLEVKVKGTKFNVKAYPDENEIETTLIEGAVSLLIPSINSSQPLEKDIYPGQSFIYSKSNQKLLDASFNKEQIEGWRNNRLIFENDKFSNLVKKVERWYNVKVVYDENKLQDRQLTVELVKDEQLDRLMEIIGLALSVNYKYQDGKIILSPKYTNMMKK
jgi:transmembrane sensor